MQSSSTASSALLKQYYKPLLIFWFQKDSFFFVNLHILPSYFFVLQFLLSEQAGPQVRHIQTHMHLKAHIHSVMLCISTLLCWQMRGLAKEKCQTSLYTYCPMLITQQTVLLQWEKSVWMMCVRERYKKEMLSISVVQLCFWSICFVLYCIKCCSAC